MQNVNAETNNKLKTLKSAISHEDQLNCALALGCNAQTIQKYLSGKGKKMVTANAIITHLEQAKSQTQSAQVN